MKWYHNNPQKYGQIIKDLHPKHPFSGPEVDRETFYDNYGTPYYKIYTNHKKYPIIAISHADYSQLLLT